MTMERLSMIAPELARDIQQVTDVQVLREAARTAAATVTNRAGVSDERVRRALVGLAEGRVHEDLRRSLGQLVDELDERAWDVQDARDAGQATEEDYLAAFAQARAVGAVVAALDTDPTMAALEATYEAHCAFADGAGVVDAVARSLNGAG